MILCTSPKAIMAKTPLALSAGQPYLLITLFTTTSSQELTDFLATDLITFTKHTSRSPITTVFMFFTKLPRSWVAKKKESTTTKVALLKKVF